MDLRWLVGAIFTGFSVALIYLHCPVSACFPGAAGVYILGSKLRDELRF